MQHDDPLLAALTPAQREAVVHSDGPLLILAGPGSGKTRVVTHRIAWLIRQGVEPSNILALTFTNKAADEMQSRLALLAPQARVWVSTFHRFCARLLRRYAPLLGLTENFTIYDSSDSAAALRRVLESLESAPARFTPQQIAAGIGWAKNNLISPDDYRARVGHPVGRIVEQAYPAYQSLLLRSSAVDFDDLLLHVAFLLRHHPEIRGTLDALHRYILVDEYQDTNFAQYTICRALSLDYPNLAVTGDPDQAIYGWRGASVRNILDFENDYPQVRVVRLEQNYRSTQRIVSAAAHLIAHNQERKRKDLFTHNDLGQKVRVITYADNQEEAASIAARIDELVRSGRRRFRDFAIFYRANALSRVLEHALASAGIPYQIVNGVEFYERREIKDVLGYLTLLNNPRDDQAFERVINTPARGIGKTSLARIREHADRRRLTLFEAARESGLIEGLPKRTAVSIARFVSLIDRLCARISAPVAELLGAVLDESGYRDMLQTNEAEDQERLANVEELRTAAREFDEESTASGLEEFLERASLVNDTDAFSAGDDRVTLMTLHASKGLEFPCVFVVALEQGLIPFRRYNGEVENLEEERRLLFVGMTRAREELQLSRAVTRLYRGEKKLTILSPFALELPLSEIEVVDDTLSASDQRAHSGDEEPFRVNSFAEHGPGSSSRRPAAARPRLALTTAAQMAAGDSAADPFGPSATADSSLEVKTTVLHPTYGLGTVVSASGSGSRQTVLVEFAASGETHSFYVAYSPLVPVRRSVSEKTPPSPE